MSRNTQALKMLSIALACLVYAGAVLYGDIMFLQIMADVFPSGIMGALAMVGAIMTAVSALILPLALHFWFAPGMQFIWGILFWALDILALGLNAILAYQVANVGMSDNFLASWAVVSPATPLLAVFGWGVAFLLDTSHKLRHAQAELESDLIDIHAKQLRAAAKDDTVYKTLVDGAQSSAAEYAGLLTSQRPSPKSNGRVYARDTVSASKND